jgi:hypothetical protein
VKPYYSNSFFGALILLAVAVERLRDVYGKSGAT